MSEQEQPIKSESREPTEGLMRQFGRFLAKWIPVAWARVIATIRATPSFVRGPLRAFALNWIVRPVREGWRRFGPLALYARLTPLVRRVWNARLLRVSRSLAARGVTIAVMGTVLAALFGGAFAVTTHRVPPGVYAVRNARFFSSGVDPTDYATGLRFGVHGFHDWHYLPARTCYLTYADRPLPNEYPLLKVRTKDSNVARVGVTVAYRVIEGEAHMLVAEGLKEAYVDKVRTTVEDILLRELANLSSTDFASTDIRLARAQSTLEILNTELRATHVRAESLTVNSVHFPGDYEQKLQETQLLAQQTIMNRALVEYENAKQDVGIERARIESAERELRGDIDMLMEQDRADAEREIADIRSAFLKYKGDREGQALADYDRLVAEGEAAVDQANAYRTKKFAEVYRSSGGQMYLASIAAANLEVEDVVLNSNDPDVPSILDLDELIGLLVGTRGE